MLLSKAGRFRATHKSTFPLTSLTIRHGNLITARENHHKVQVQKIAGSLGATIGGVDLRTLDEPTTKQIRQALLDNKVIFFRNQDLTPSELLNFARHFGQPQEYPFVKGIDDYPQIIQVLKQEHERNNFGGVWNSDTTYLPDPPMATILLGKEIPPYGGDTLFANQAAAYSSLSEGLKKLLSTLKAVNTSAKADVSKTREDRIKDSGSDAQPEDLVSRHPVVRTHPETGKKVLYVNVAHTERFEGWTTEESAPLLEFLFRHQVKPEFTCRFRWQRGSVAVWDNRSCQHNPINDYHGFRRCMQRITLAGDRPV